MGEKESDKPAQVNLELPAFGLRRKRKSKGAGESEGPAEEALAGEEAAPAQEAASVAKTPAPEAEVSDAPAEPVAAAEPVAPAPAAPAAASRFTPPAASKVEPAPDPVPARESLADPLDTEPVDEVEADRVDPARPKKSLRDQLPEFKAPRLPVIPTMTASAITGLVIGLLACAGTFLGLRGCEMIVDNSSCGGPGLLVVLLILVLLVLAGTGLLKLFAVPDAGSVSFLAVGLLAMLVLLILIPWIFEWWMLIVIPVIAACTYMAAHWITSLFDED